MEELRQSNISDDELQALVEALLFAAGEPLKLATISEICEVTETRMQDILTGLADTYTNNGSGLLLRKADESYFFTTDPKWQEYLARLFRPEHRPALTNAAYEVLACIAYNQPCTRAQVELVRGVNSDHLISRLVERGLIEESGQLDLPGKPAVFSVTAYFLQEFGLNSVADLPAHEMLMYDILNKLS